jgi:mono/diheme cytochrome c family protein
LRFTRRGKLRSRSSTASPNRPPEPRELTLLPRRLLAVAALALVAAAVSGCGAVNRVTSGDPSQGKALFQAKCASCHTLADAKAQGTIGPNLDDAFSSDKAQGFSQQTMADVVRGQIAYPEAPMPSKLVEGSDADDVALYVAKCAANPTCGVTAATTTPTTATSTTTTTSTTATSTGSTSPAAAGKQVFASAGCGGCHTLKDAGTTGTVGPNLDQLKPPAARVSHQVEVGGGAMPAFKGRLSAAQIQAVAAYVSSVAGK